jgi:hypothetical protein
LRERRFSASLYPNESISLINPLISFCDNSPA